MTDIDFDELDKAVNSLMNKQQGGDTKEDNVSTGQAEVPSVASQTVPTPVVDEPMQATSLTDSLFGGVNTPSAEPKSEADVVDAAPAEPAEKDEPLVSPPSIVKRPSGRFMDVVHPSSDMTTQRPAMTRSPRTSVSLRPVGSMSEIIEQAKEDMMSPAAVTPPVSASLDVKEESHLEESEFVQDGGRPAENLEPAAETSEPSLTEKIAESLAQNSASEPLTSPFIENVEVEKRPLGVINTIPVPEETVETGDIAEESELQTDEPPVAPAIDASVQSSEVADLSIEQSTQTQPEFDPALVAVEEGSSDSEAVEESPVVQQFSSEVDEMEPATPFSTGDIPPQYTPDTEQTDPQPQPMFDAAVASTQALQHKEKKKSGWLTFLLIILFLAIGVAGGAAAYFLLIQ